MHFTDTTHKATPLGAVCPNFTPQEIHQMPTIASLARRVLAAGLCTCLFGIADSQVVPWSWTVGGGPSVVVDGEALPFPWTGGLTAPQWSPVDFDGDGDDDVFSCDRDGGRVLLFERTPSGFVERPDWAVGFPELTEWALLVDYDCDGLADLFTGFQNGVHVYRHAPAGTFTPVAQPLYASWDFGSGPSQLPMVVLTLDKPSIADLNGDGALDVHAFTETSTTVYAYTGQTPCGLDFVVTNRCYAMFDEGSEDNSVFIGDDHTCSFNVADPRDTDPAGQPEEPLRHAGGSLTALQLDGLGGHDLLVGDVSFGTLVALVLEEAVDGQDSTAWYDPAFPAELPHTGLQDSVYCWKFPAAWPIDADADGVVDLVISPHTDIETEDDRCVHLWRNAGTADAPVWEFVTDTWIQGGTLDVGRGAAPVFVDLDGDGLLDLALGNKERYEGVGATPTELALFRNTGTATAPEFTLMNWSAVDFSANAIESAYPTFADLDGDGDVDLLVGDELGLLHAYTNAAGPGAWPEFILPELSVTDATGTPIDVGQFATPQTVDLDGIPPLDLLIGEKNGTLTAYFACPVGSGGHSWCLWTSPTTGENWGGIVVDNALGINGYSVPCLLPHGDVTEVFVANELGQLQYFGPFTPGTDPGYLPEISAAAGGFQPGLRAAAALADLTSDGIPELAIGIRNGGVRWYSGTATSVTAPAPDRTFALHPNPSPGSARLTGAAPAAAVAIFSTDGRLLHTERTGPDGTAVLPVLPAGSYIVTSGTTSLKWVVRN